MRLGAHRTLRGLHSSPPKRSWAQQAEPELQPLPSALLSRGLVLPSQPRRSPAPPLRWAFCFLDPVAGPYIVYMLQEIDILEDWTAIKKVGPCCLLAPVPGSRERDWRAGACPAHALVSAGSPPPGSLAFRPLTRPLLSEATLPQQGASSPCGPFLFLGRF